MDPLAKLMLDSLKCPICQGRIDIFSESPYTKTFNFCCSNDWEHYHLWFVHWEAVLGIMYEEAVIYDGQRKYVLNQHNGDDSTKILIYKVDAEGNYIGDNYPQIFSYDKKLFDFSKTTREKMLNRVKTILVFQ